MKRGFNSGLIGVIVLLLGLIIVLIGAYLAYEAYQTYKPVLPKGSSLDEAITNTAYELVNLVLKLGFLGVMVWGGSILLKNGLNAVVEVYRIDKGSRECSPQQKQESQ